MIKKLIIKNNWLLITLILLLLNIHNGLVGIFDGEFKGMAVFVGVAIGITFSECIRLMFLEKPRKKLDAIKDAHIKYLQGFIDLLLRDAPNDECIEYLRNYGKQQKENYKK